MGEKHFQLGENGGMDMSKQTLPHQHQEGKEIPDIMEQLSKIDDFQTIAEIFKQLGDTTRIRIFFLLCHCEECVINISAMLDMSSPCGIPPS